MRTVRLSLAIACFIASISALAGAPMARFDLRVSRRVPLGGTLWLAATANCMGQLPPGLGPGLRLVTQQGQPVPGQWRRDPRFVTFGGPGVRWVFVPVEPLAAGEYRIDGVDTKGARGAGGGVHSSYPVSVAPTGPSGPPKFTGMRGARCASGRGYYEGCDGGQGIYIEAPDSPLGLVFVRPRGKPYDADHAWETGRLTDEMLSRVDGDQIIFTFLARGPAGRLGGTPCEVQLNRRKELCAQFPKGGVSGIGSFGGGGIKRARCASAAGRGIWQSQIDGVNIRLRELE